MVEKSPSPAPDSSRRRRRGRQDGKDDRLDNKDVKKNAATHNKNNNHNQSAIKTNDFSPASNNNKSNKASSSSYKPHQSLLIQLTDDVPTWFDCGKNIQGRNATILTDPPQQSGPKNDAELVARYRSLADQMFRTELELFEKNQQQYQKSGSSSSDQQWIQNTMKHGTLKDRIAAMSVVVSTNPVHKFYSLDGLLHMAGCNANNSGSANSSGSSSKTASDSSSSTNSRVAQMAAEAIEELFLNTLLPPDRKLISMDQRPFYKYEAVTTAAAASTVDTNNTPNSGNKKRKKSGSTTTTTPTQQTLSPRVLLLWRFEELIKEKYHLFLTKYLERTLRREGLEMSRIAALRTASNLIRSVPEGEGQLLSMMVNKLGDPSKKVAAAAGHELRRLVDQHSNMQAIVAREVQQLAHRPHLSPRALYNCITFLNQLRLYKEDEDEKHDEKNKKDKAGKVAVAAAAAVTTNEKSKKPTSATFTNSKSLPASLIKTYFQLFEVAIHRTESAKQKESASNNSDSVAMKGRLLSALLTGVNRAHPFLPEKDQELEEHVDALYRIVHTAPPSACTQALMLLYQLAMGSSSSSSSAKSQKHKTTKNSNNKTAGKPSSDQRKARQDRFYRALYATMAQQQPSSLLSSGKHLTLYCNLLYKAMKYDTESTRVVAFAKQLLCTVLHNNPCIVAASLFLLNEVSKYHSTSTNHNMTSALQECWVGVMKGRDAEVKWDPTKREPRGALTWKDNDSDEKEGSNEGDAVAPTRTPLWELSLTAHHFHPSIAKFTTSMGEISYSGDPLKDFGLGPFLNKFAYRNPKSMEHLAKHFHRGESVAERKSGVAMETYLTPPVNDPSFAQQEHVSEQDEFFHKFFVERARRDKIKGIVRPSASENIEGEEEDVAFDAAEASVMDQDFEKIEEGWETDSEEEAFVDSLALSLMEDSMDNAADLDDEDPDMDDWGDLKVEENEPDVVDVPDDASENSSAVKNDDDSDDEDDEILEVEGQDSSDDTHDEDTDEEGDEVVDSENEVDIADGTDSESSGERPPRKKRVVQPTFADASDFEELINKDWNNLRGNGNKSKPQGKMKR